MAIALLAAGGLRAQTRVTAIPIGPQPALVHPTQMILNPATNKLYVVGDGGAIAVVDALTNRTLSHIAGANGAQNGLFVNPAANRIYLVSGSIQVIDGATDTVVQTVLPPPLANTVAGTLSYGSSDYNPVTNRLYVVETFENLNSVFVSQLVALDGTTLAQTAVLLGSPAAPTPYFPGRIVVNPNNNTIYGFFSQSTTFYWLFDGATNTRIGGSSCAGTQCSYLIRGGIPSMILVNPVDKMVWLTSDCTPPTVLAGGNGSAAPPNNPLQSCVTRLDGSLELNGVYVPSSIVYGEFSGTGFDPANGRLVGFGACLPASATPPVPSFTVCRGPITGDTGPTVIPAVFDPVHPDKLIAVNLTGVPFDPSFTNGTSCGLGYFNAVGADPALGNLYWGSVDCTGTHPANLVMAKSNFGGTPAATLPPSLTAQWVANLPTKIMGNMVPPFADITVDPFTHRTFFLDTGETSVIALDPAVPAVTSQQLGSKPAGLAVNSSTNTVFVGDATSGALNAFNGATNLTVPQTRVGAGPMVAVNRATNQVVVAGPSAPATDPNQVQGAVLVSGISGSVILPLQAAATAAVAVNPATNIAYFANTTQWYAVSLQNGARVFTGSDLSGTGADACTITGLDVSAATNRVYVAGKCQTNGQTLAVFDGATNTQIQQVSLGAFITAGANFGFGRLVVNPAGNKIYLENIRLKNLGGTANLEDPAIEVFDGGTLAHTTTIAGLRGPMAVNAATNVIYICLSACYAIDGGTDTMLGNFGTAITSVAVNDVTNTVYVTGDTGLSGIPAEGMVTEYRGFPAAFTVSGTVVKGGAAMAGVTVGISGAGLLGVNASTTDANGRFVLTHVPAGNYTVAPTTAGFVYTPASQSVTVVNANVSGVNFTAAPTFSIGGQVVDSLGVGLAGISVQGPLGTVVTDVNGQFSLANYPSGTYAIAPVSPGFLFTPVSQSVTVAGANFIGVSFTAVPVFNIRGSVVDSTGAGIAGITVVSQTGVSATAVTSASGAYTLTGFPAGSYTIAPATAGFIYGPETQTVKVAKADVTAVNFTVIPSMVITSYTLSPYSVIGPGVVTSGTVTLNQAAPLGGVLVTLSAGDLKPAKFPSSVTVPAGQTSVSFSVQGNGVSVPTATSLIASYQGGLASQPASASVSLTVAPSDTLRVTAATWSKSTQLLQVTAASTNAQAIVAVLNANGNVPLGTMTNLGGGNYQLQVTVGSLSSVLLKSNLGGSAGQGVSIVP